MNPLLRRLAMLRLKVRFLDGWQGICAIITLLLTVGVSVGVLDYFVHLPTLVRAAFLVGLLVGAGLVVYRYLIQPFGKKCDDLNLALRIEEEYPELNDALASTVQFLKQSKAEQARLGGSEAMLNRTVQDAVDKAAGYDFSRVLKLRASLLFGVAALCALGAATWVTAAHRPYATIAFWRLVEPFGMHTWTQVTVARAAPFEAFDADQDNWPELDPRSTEKDRIAIGRPYIIKVHLTGQIPKQARVEIEGKIRSDMNVTKLTPGENDQEASFVTPINMTQQYQTFKFRVVANDGSFPPRSGAWHTVEVMHKPKLIELDGKPSPQIEISPPAYTDLPSPVKLLPGIRHLELLAGTHAVYRAKADRPLVQALIRWQPEDPWQLEAAQLLGGVAVSDKVYANLEEDKSVFTIPLLPWTSGTYVLYMRDKYGLESEDVADIRVVKDPLPVVRLLRPASTAEFTPDAQVPFKFLVTDEKYAVRSVFIEYRRKAQDDKDLDANATTAILYDASANGKLIPWQLAQFGLARVPDDLRLRRSKLEFDMVWSLKNQFKPGEIVVVEVGAHDFCNISAEREGKAGRSHQIELRIISKGQLLADVERKLGKIQEDLERAAKLEKKAIDAVKQTRKEEKIDQAVKDKFNDNADQPQKDVRDIIGKDATEGLRGELAKLRQTLKANKLDNTQPYRDAGKLKGQLDNIAQEELQQLEPKLQQLRTELNHNDKNNPKIQKKLDETAKLQQNVADTLNELIGKMDPTAEARKIRVEMREIIAKEQQLREDLAKLKADKQKDDMDAPEFKANNEKNYQKKVQQKAEEQKDLAQRLEKLVKEMKAEQKNQEKLGHKEEAEKLKEAIKQLEQPKNAKKPMQEENKLPVNAQMKKVAEDLKNKSEPPENALKQQQDIAKDLEKALDALEGKNPDMARQEIQNRKDAEKKIDQHVRELKKLQEKEKEADKIKNMEERLKKKQEIAEQLADLQQKMEKTRRELAQLQEQQAANAVKEAIKNVEKAEQRAQQGQNAQQEEQQAQDKLREAKNKVRDSEEELAREMLIRMADQLKGLKERQDASLKRTEDLHPKVMRIKSWSDALLDTMEGNLDAQKSITEETGDLQKKLDGAVVFGGILERAKKSMENAGNLMDNRYKEGKDRRYVVDGKKMDEMEVKDELEWQTDTVKNQKQAARSLTNLLDSLKEEIEKKKQQLARNEKNDNPPEEDDKKPKGGVPEQDGIPPMAQLKALKAEQLDLNERTAEFDKLNPDPAKLDERQRAELRELEREQERLQELFQRLTTPPPQLPKDGGDMP